MNNLLSSLVIIGTDMSEPFDHIFVIVLVMLFMILRDQHACVVGIGHVGELS